MCTVQHQRACNCLNLTAYACYSTWVHSELLNTATYTGQIKHYFEHVWKQRKCSEMCA